MAKTEIKLNPVVNLPIPKEPVKLKVKTPAPKTGPSYAELFDLVKELKTELGAIRATLSTPAPKVKKSKTATGKRGRSAKVFTKSEKRSIAASLKKHGLVGGAKDATDNKGIKVNPIQAKKIAEEFGLTFSRGRPAKAA